MTLEKKKISAKDKLDRYYTAIIHEDNGVWIGWIEDVPGVNCQEDSREELLESLKVTLKEILEIYKEDSLAIAGHKFQEIRIRI
jgi:predicted RNase H-like HicB family nuclease